jgi:60 kDa SS-A/Ro ribonucleoprotein
MAQTNDPLSDYRPASTPATNPIPGRETEMVRNEGGGYVFAKDVWTRLADFLILGTEGGAYCVGEREHTYANVQVVRDALAADGVRAVRLAVEVSTARPARAPRNQPALFVLAAALASEDLATRQAAAGACHMVARTTDHLARLFGYYKNLKGKPSGRTGRSGNSSPVVRRAWTNWFIQDNPDAVAYRLLKSRARKTGDGEPFKPGDLLRVARPRPRNEAEEVLFALAVGKTTPEHAGRLLPNAKAFHEAQLADTPAKAVRAINLYGVPWEFLPDAVLKHPEVWEALVPHLGLTALIRNLSRMTQNGALGPFKQSNGRVAARLTDQAALYRARIHPFDLLLALKVYESGRAQPNPNAPLRTWTPVPEVVTALNAAYNLSFAVAENYHAKLVVAVDKSGSMGNQVVSGGSMLGSAYHVGSAVAQILMRTHGSAGVWPVEFDTEVLASKLREDMSLSEVFNLPHTGGGTDIGSPIAWALANRLHVDGFVLITDNVTWAGGHPSAVLRDYRRVVNPAARVVVAATTANGYQVVDPQDGGVLNIAGFDSHLATLIASFIGTAVGAAADPEDTVS